MNKKDKIITDRLPKHIAIIMDGNGRWAKEKGKDRLFGHYSGVESVRNIVEGCAELGIQNLTLYAFSTENWDRPKDEVSGLMELLVQTIRQEVPTLNKNNIRLFVIGNKELLPASAQKELNEACEETQKNTGMSLIMALSYSSRWEILDAVKKEDPLCIEIVEQVGATIGKYIAGLINIFNPELVVIGGVVSQAEDFLLLPVKNSIRKYSLNLVNRDSKIALSKLKQKAGIVGACMVARSRLFDDTMPDVL